MKTYIEFNSKENIMGGGCLSPKARIGQIYIDAIKSIHQQAEKANAQQSVLYDAAREKIAKSGFLRKLIDYLISHRTTIPEAMSYNSQLVSQTKQKKSNYAGLMVADQIIKIVCERQIENNKQFMSKSIKIAKDRNQILGIEPNRPRKISKQQQLERQQQQTHNYLGAQNQNFIGHKNMVEQYYFNLILSFMRLQDDSMYVQLLKSLQKYAGYHIQDYSNFSLKNTQLHVSQKAQLVLQILLKHITADSFKQESIRVYSKLIRSIKWYPNSHRKSHNLRFFIRTWILQMQQDSLLAHQCSLIIEEYIDFYINNQQSTKVYEAVIELYDELQFADIKFFEAFLKDLLNRHGLKGPFLRGLFLYLLGYVSWCKHPNLQARWNITYPSIINEATRNSFPNIYQLKSKLNAIKTIRKWLDYEFVDINQILAYSNLMLIQAYLFNVCEQLQKKATKVAKQIMIQFHLICPEDTNTKLQMNGRLKIVQAFLDQINWIHAQESYQTMLIQQTRKFVSTLTSLQPLVQEVIHPLTTNISSMNKLKLIKLNGEILIRIGNLQISNHILNEHIDTFLFSVFENISIDGHQQNMKFQIISHTLQFVSVLIRKKQKAIVLAYWQHINKNVKNTQKSVKTRYILLFFSLKLLALLQESMPNKIPHQMLLLNQKIKNNSQISPQMQQNLSRVIKSAIQQNSIESTQINLQIMDKQNYQQNKHSLNLLFSPSNDAHPRNSKYEQQNLSLSDRSVVGRRLSTNGNQQNEYHNDGSFCQILQIMNR